MKFDPVHTNITVADLDRSVAFYHKAFGLNPVRRVDGADGAFKLVFLEAAEGGHRLELTWFRDSGESDAYRPGDNQSRLGFLPHLGFVPDDFDEALALHKEMGVVCFESPKRGVYFVEDPDGYWMEIVPRSRAF